MPCSSSPSFSATLVTKRDERHPCFRWRAMPGNGRCRRATVPLSFDRGYRLDVADLRPHISARTKLVSLASRRILRRRHSPRRSGCHRRDVGTMSGRLPGGGETYREATYGDAAVAPSAVPGSNVVSCASLSKCHAPPGLRLGWTISEIARCASSWRSESSIPSSPALPSTKRWGSRFSSSAIALCPSDAAPRRRLARTEAGCGRTRPCRLGPADAGAICCVRLKPSAFDGAAVSRFYDDLTREG